MGERNVVCSVGLVSNTDRGSRAKHPGTFRVMSDAFQDLTRHGVYDHRLAANRTCANSQTNVTRKWFRSQSGISLPTVVSSVVVWVHALE